jgi:magnesium chelatase family protein
MKGMPGSGKSMLAQRITTIMPELTLDEMLEIGIINSISNSLKHFTISPHIPFRSPHHSASTPSIVGGGKKAKPGEITLAHKGILFLDEFAEYPSNVLEALRQPMETREITISRAENHITYPADFQLIAAMNPCKCGYLGDVKKECSKAPLCAEDYTRKISGPIMERIDMHIIVNPSTANIFEKETKPAETSRDVKERVLKARKIQLQRFGRKMVNAKMSTSETEKFCKLDAECERVIQNAMERFGLSIRQYHKILKVSRTIADLSQCENIQKPHLMEALGYRV